MSIKQNEEKIIQKASCSHGQVNCKGPCQTLTTVYYWVSDDNWCLVFRITFHGMWPCLLISGKVVISHTETMNLSTVCALNLNKELNTQGENITREKSATFCSPQECLITLSKRREKEITTRTWTLAGTLLELIKTFQGKKKRKKISVLEKSPQNSSFIINTCSCLSCRSVSVNMRQYFPFQIR